METLQNYILSYIKSNQSALTGAKKKIKETINIFKDFRNYLKEFMNMKDQFRQTHSMSLKTI